jgi:hypothetical protein
MSLPGLIKSIPGLISTIYENLILTYQKRKAKLRAKQVREAREAKETKEAELRAEQVRRAEEDVVFDDADIQIKKALQHVDSLGGYLDDEKAANQQLCVALKALTQDKGIPINLEPRYNGENIGDIQIGNTVIEGKLDLFSKGEIDRLIGQTQLCCSHTTYRMRIVIYGEISQRARERINEISSHYAPGIVRLIVLPNPKRRRRRDILEES